MTGLERFTQGYIDAALWSSTDDEGEPLDRYCLDDIAPETMDRMRKDCAAFYAANIPAIDNGPVHAVGCSNEEYAGHDFWLTRNGHGAGYWDGDWPEPAATALADRAKAFGECDLYIGDDGLIYCM